ncbi:hypothetical protein FRB96_007668 [Tulasnella sp. 330]|nr:hypothetical protein FRB96_007668 [Tulasnella sp. 330]KAG8880748.1 hypothetical protein FRB97_000541 [Tulasnella sp. 331]KAG8889634.1 hypothetical protein FRB98_003437 [Tulasnella sp. 332]
MSSRAAGGGPSIQEIITQLDLRDRLLFSQVIYELGCDWPKVSQLLAHHPLIDLSKKNFFSSQACQGIYLHLMRDFGSGFNDKIPDAARLPKAAKNLALAQECYKLRVAQLREEILVEERKFKKRVQEMEDIRLDRPIEFTDQPATMVDKRRKSKQPVATPSRRSTRSGTRVSEAPSSIAAEPVEDEDEGPVPLDIVPGHKVGTKQETLEEFPAENNGPDGIMAAEGWQGAYATGSTRWLTHSVATPGTDIGPSTPTEPTISFLDAVASQHPIPEEPMVHEDIVDHQMPRVPTPTPTAEPITSSSDSSVPTSVDAVSTTLVATEKEATISESKDSPRLTTPATPTDPTTDGLPPKAEPAQRRATRRQTLVRSGKLKAPDDSPSAPTADKKRSLAETPMEDDSATPSKRPRASTISSVSAASSKKMMGVLHNRISEHRFGNIFHNPIKRADAPDYYTVIKRPMDLKTIKQRIKEGTVKDSQEFQRDVYLMYANALMFNGPQTDIFRMTMEMMQETEKDFQLQLQSEVYRPN